MKGYSVTTQNFYVALVVRHLPDHLLDPVYSGAQFMLFCSSCFILIIRKRNRVITESKGSLMAGSKCVAIGSFRHHDDVVD